jgi:16S rRNA (uracil1498-N3)-methyltransferase
LRVTHARFYAPALDAPGTTVTLPAEEGRHLVRVLRLRVGAPVRLFNGRGLECNGHVEAVDRDEVTIAAGPMAVAAPEPSTAIILAQALLKGDGMDGVIRDAVMLGVAAIAPLLTARIEGDRQSHGAGRVARWERIAIASAKQCGRAVVPPLLPPTTLSSILASAEACGEAGAGAGQRGGRLPHGRDTGFRVVLVEPLAPLPPVGLRELANGPPPPAASLFVGPEGGWTEDELRLLAGHQARAITLGGRTLRAESAAVVGLSVLHTLWGEFA